MTVSVVTHPLKDLRIGLYATEESVAGRAESSTNLARDMTMVHEQVTLHAADETFPVLGKLHFVDLRRSQAVFALVSGAQILSFGSFRVRGTPFTQAFVAASLVCLGILASHGVAAILAIGAEIIPRLGKVIKREVLLAFRARLHISSMTWRRDNAGRRAVYQPCHADVLLHIANDLKETK